MVEFQIHQQRKALLELGRCIEAFGNGDIVLTLLERRFGRSLPVSQLDRPSAPLWAGGADGELATPSLLEKELER
jgi:hypothetical protein